MRGICVLLGLGIVCASLPEAAAQAAKDRKKTPAAPAPAPAPAPGAPAAPSEAELRDRAKQHYDKGITHYNLGDFDLAVEQFKAAYALTSEPGLLFNIAQAYRLKEDYKQSLYFYKTYLRVLPDAANRADVERWIAELERLHAEQNKIRNSKPQDTIAANPATSRPGDPEGEPGGAGKPGAPPPADAAVQVKDSRDDEDARPIEPDPVPVKLRGRGWKLAGMSAAGAGVVFLVAGAWMGSTAADDWDAVNALADANGTWTREYQDTWDEAERYETWSTVAYIGGAAGLVLGGAFYYMGMREASESRAEVNLSLGRGGGSVTVGWGF